MIALILLGDNYQVLEFWYPKYRLIEQNISVTVISPNIQEYYSEERYPAMPDLKVTQVEADKYDILIIPGGKAPRKLKEDEHILNLVRNFKTLNKPIAAICHGAEILIAANVVEGIRISCAPDIEKELINAGGFFENKAVTVHKNFISSRNPDDLPHFMQAILTMLISTKR